MGRIGQPRGEQRVKRTREKWTDCLPAFIHPLSPVRALLSERLKQAIVELGSSLERLYRKGILPVNRPQFSKNLQAAGGDQEPPNPNPHPKMYRIPPGYSSASSRLKDADGETP